MRLAVEYTRDLSITYSRQVPFSFYFIYPSNLDIPTFEFVIHIDTSSRPICYRSVLHNQSKDRLSRGE